MKVLWGEVLCWRCQKVRKGLEGKIMYKERCVILPLVRDVGGGGVGVVIDAPVPVE